MVIKMCAQEMHKIRTFFLPLHLAEILDPNQMMSGHELVQLCQESDKEADTWIIAQMISVHCTNQSHQKKQLVKS